jgi:LuxR family maltose regulon positive regulatory protein
VKAIPTELTRSAVASTRLEPQNREEGHILRETLLARLDDVLSNRVTIVRAGAGYGKTSLLTQWFRELRHRKIAAAWLTLGEDDTSAATCIESIVAALANLGHVNFGPVSSLDRANARIPLSSVITAFVNALAVRPQPLVILLDEYNRAQSAETDAMFRILVRSVPRQVHIVIASRGPPAMDLENLRAHDDLVEIAAVDLRFSQSEVAALFSRSGASLTDGDARRLTDRTEGWPIAVQMARLWLCDDKRRARMVSEFSGRTSDLANYLAEQVLRALPDEAQRFLMQISILDRINGDLANAVTGRRDGWRMLDDLHTRDLFLIPEGDERQWFRYHTLLRDFLLDRLVRRHADQVLVLHRRAAEWFAGCHELKWAVSHAVKAGEHEFAAKLLSDAGGWRLIMEGRMNLIRSGIEALPDRVVRRHLPLALARTFLRVKAGDVQGAREYFDSIATDPAAPESEQGRTERQIVEHIVSDYADKPTLPDDIERLQALRECVPRHDHMIHAVLADSLATMYCEFGRFRESLDACEDAIHRYRMIGSLYGEIFLRFTQTRSQLARGRLEEAETLLRQTERELELRFGEGIDLSAHTSIYLAELLSERGKFGEAAARLEKALPVAEQRDGWFELYAAAYTAAAAVAWATQGLDATLGMLGRARAVARERSLGRLSLLADCATVHYLCLGGRADEAAILVPTLSEAASGAAGAADQRLGEFVAAARTELALAQGRYIDAECFLRPFVRTAESSGEVRMVVALALLRANAQYSTGRTQEAAATLDQAVRVGMFSGLRRPYLEYAAGQTALIDIVLRGESSLLPDRYRDGFLRDLHRDLRRAKRRNARNGLYLTPAEHEVLRELDCGYSNKEIARRLGISPNTVKFRLKGLYQKLGVSARDDAVRISRERALLTMDNPTLR